MSIDRKGGRGIFRDNPNAFFYVMKDEVNVSVLFYQLITAVQVSLQCDAY